MFIINIISIFIVLIFSRLTLILIHMNIQAAQLKGVYDQFAEVRKVIAAIKSNTSSFKLQDHPEIVDARPGYKMVNGILTDEKAIVFLVDKKIDPELLERPSIPKTIDGIVTDVDNVSPFEFVRKSAFETMALSLPGLALQGNKYLVDSAEFEAIASLQPVIGYVKPANVHLDAVEEEMTVICHVSPEQGWKQLKQFLTGVTDELRVGMYDFSTTGIRDALKAIAADHKKISLVYDGKSAAGVGSGNKKDDVLEDAIIDAISVAADSGKFEHVKAKLGRNGLFANAYHIKVAVKDQKAFWLSSGNWQSSNQPDLSNAGSFADILHDYNREWHIIVMNAKLATIYYEFLKYDADCSKVTTGGLEFMALDFMQMPDILLPINQMARTNNARPFDAKIFEFKSGKKLKIQPLLTPDNYINQVLPLIKKAQHKLYFQNQYITIKDNLTPEYQELLNALLAKSKDAAIDFRVILRNEGDVRLMVENLKAFGFDQAKIRIQDNCHNKGILIDDAITVIGSHNYSNSGVQFNRDASLIIYHPDITAYYQQVFLFDWERLGSPRIPSVRVAAADETAAGSVKRNWESLYD